MVNSWVRDSHTHLSGENEDPWGATLVGLRERDDLWLVEEPADCHSPQLSWSTVQHRLSPSLTFRREVDGDGDGAVSYLDARARRSVDGQSEHEDAQDDEWTADRKSSHEGLEPFFRGPVIGEVDHPIGGGAKLSQVRIALFDLFGREAECPFSETLLIGLAYLVKEVCQVVCDSLIQMVLFSFDPSDQVVRLAGRQGSVLDLCGLHYEHDLVQRDVVGDQDPACLSDDPSNSDQRQNACANRCPERQVAHFEMSDVGESKSSDEDRPESSDHGQDPFCALAQDAGGMIQPPGRLGAQVSQVVSRRCHYLASPPRALLERVDRMNCAQERLTCDDNGITIVTTLAWVKGLLFRSPRRVQVKERSTMPTPTRRSRTDKSLPTASRRDQMEKSSLSTGVPAEVKEWDDTAVREEGIVSVRDLSQHTTQVIKAVEERGRAVFVTRHSRIVASITPVSMRDVVDRMVASGTELTDGMTMADKTLEAGETVPSAALTLDGSG
jgi:prevent-host-death family protein